MCAPYWPDEVGKSLNFDDLVIELLYVKNFEDYTQRELKLTKEAVSKLYITSSYNVVYLPANN